MLRRTQVEPFLSESRGLVRVEFLEPEDAGRTTAFLNRLCRLARRLEGWPRAGVLEALERQERRVRDVRRLAGVSKSLLDRCSFRPRPGADRAEHIRSVLFAERGKLWPPRPGDVRLPYMRAAKAIGLDVDEIDRVLYADSPMARVLTRAPRFDGDGLLSRYNLDLARGVLLDATRVTVTAEGGWRDIFRAVKLARLMYRLEAVSPQRGNHAGHSHRYRLELTGPAAAFVTHSQRYGARFARVVPALARAPGWRLEADIARDGETMRYTLDHHSPVGGTIGRPTYDSAWERALADDFSKKLGDQRDGWSLTREETPVAVDGELFLPDFTLRHRDGRTALIEIIGFWAPDYLETKLRKVRAAGLDHLILVVYEGLAAGTVETATSGPVLWFKNRPRIGPVMEAAERVARS